MTISPETAARAAEKAARVKERKRQRQILVAERAVRGERLAANHKLGKHARTALSACPLCVPGTSDWDGRDGTVSSSFETNRRRH